MRLIVRHTSTTPLALVLLSASTVLAACGGAGDAAGPTGSGGGPGGSVASFTTYALPGANQSTVIPVLNEFHSTNDGVYVMMQDSRNLADPRRSIIKLDPGGAGSWVRWDPDEFLMHFVPVKRNSEVDREISVYYTAQTDDDELQWGMFNMNNGSPSFVHEDDMYIWRTIAGGPQTSMQDPWVIDIDGTVWRDDRSATASNQVSDVFGEEIATLPLGLEELSQVKAVAHESDGTLWVGTGSRVFRLGTSGIERTFDLSQLGSGSVTRLLASDGKIWVGYGNRVVRFDGDEGTVVATVARALAAELGGFFCVRGSTVYTADGLAVTGGSSHSFVRGDGSLSGGDAAKAAELETTLAVGTIACTPGEPTQPIWVLLPDKVYAIQPK